MYDSLKNILGGQMEDSIFDNQHKTDAEVDAWEARLEREAMEKRLRASGIPEKYLKSTFQDFKTETTAQKAMKKKGMDYAQVVTRNEKNTSNFLLYGPSGTGKTKLACCIINGVVTTVKEEFYGIPKYYTAGYVTELQLADDWKQSQSFNASTDYKKMKDRYSGFDLLVIDEVGTAENPGAIVDIIGGRYDKQKPTLLITNLPFENFKNKFPAATLSRLASRWGTFSTEGIPDLRPEYDR